MEQTITKAGLLHELRAARRLGYADGRGWPRAHDRAGRGRRLVGSRILLDSHPNPFQCGKAG